MSEGKTRCVVHGSEWRAGKWACEYFLIWCRDVVGLAECKKGDSV